MNKSEKNTKQAFITNSTAAVLILGLKLPKRTKYLI